MTKLSLPASRNLIAMHRPPKPAPIMATSTTALLVWILALLVMFLLRERRLRSLLLEGGHLRHQRVSLVEEVAVVVHPRVEAGAEEIQPVRQHAAHDARFADEQIGHLQPAAQVQHAATLAHHARIERQEQA